MRVLHVIDPGSAGGGSCTLQLLADAMARCGSIQHELLVLGTSSHVDLARRCGLEPRGQLAPPRLTPRSSWKPLTHVVQELEREGGRRFDWCHAWTLRSAAAAAALPWRPRLIAGLCIGPDRPGSLSAARIWNRRPGLLLVSGESIQRAYEAIGLQSNGCRILPPAVDAGRIDRCGRAALRRRWGVDADTFTVAALSEPSNWLDSWMAIEIVCRVALTGRRVRLVLPPTATGLATSRRRLRALEQDHILVIDDQAVDPWRVVAGLDAAIVLGAAPGRESAPREFRFSNRLRGGWSPARPEPGVMPLLWAMAAGLPTVVERSGASEEIVRSPCTGTLIAPGDLHEATHRLLELRDDRDQAREIGSAAAAVVDERFHMDRYARELAGIYAGEASACRPAVG